MAADQKIISGEDINGNQPKEPLYRSDIKHMLHVSQRTGLIFAATFLACIVLYHAAFPFQVYSSAITFSPSSSVSSLVHSLYQTIFYCFNWFLSVRNRGECDTARDESVDKF